MPAPAGNYFNIKRLNRIFAVCALMLLGSMLWAVWQDFDRPWRRIQREGRTWSVALIDHETELLKTAAIGNPERLDSLRRQRAELEPQGFWGQTGAWLRSLPLLQFISPRERVRQVTVSDVQTDLSFTKTETTDRCITCHINIDRPEFARDRVLSLLEAELTRTRGAEFTEQIRAKALGKATPLSPLLQEKYRFALLAEVNSIRQSGGRKALDPSPVFLAHPNLDLYASVNSPHAIEKVGCTSCHDGSGNETDFVLAAHRPRKLPVDSNTGEPILATQLTGPATDESLRTGHPYVDPVTGRKGVAILQKQFWIKRFGAASASTLEDVERHWDTPMRQGPFMQAACARCHTGISDIARQAPLLHEGRALFTQRGCSNCHALAGVSPADPQQPRTGDTARMGGDLRNLPAKLSPEFVNSWIWAPQGFRPTTLMPHFFGLENNSRPEEIRRTRLESRAITQYLMATASRSFAPRGVDPKLRGDPIKGQEIFERIGCTACHTNLADPVEWEDAQTKKQPTMRRAQAWIVDDLLRKSSQAAGQSSPAPTSEEDARTIYEGMSYDQKQRYCLEHFGQTLATSQQETYADGTPRPRFVRMGPELSGVGQKLLAGRTRESASAWLADWLRNPRHYSGTTTMPSLRLGEQEAAHLVEYLLAQTRKNLDPRDDWNPVLFDVDASKLNELVAWVLRARHLPEQADQLATRETAPDGQPGEITRRAVAILTGPTLLSPDQARSAVAGMSLTQKQLLILGQRMTVNYGCSNCHAINGLESAPSPCPDLTDWGHKAVNRLDFGSIRNSGLGVRSAGQDAAGQPPAAMSTSQSPAAPQSTSRGTHPDSSALVHTREGWLQLKLANPRIYDRGREHLEPRRNPKVPADAVLPPADRGRPYDKLKMPQFDLTPREIQALVTFVTSNRPPLISDRMLAAVNTEHRTRLARGRQIVERLHCTSCHNIEGNEPAISQYFAEEREDMSRYRLLTAPDLGGEGARVQPAWLFGFLKNVEPIRPQAQLRMPSFHLDDRQSETMAAYFAAVAQDESRWLRKRLDPIDRYLRAQEAAGQRLTEAMEDPGVKRHGSNPATPGTLPQRPPASPVPWYQNPSLAEVTRDLEQWGLSRRLPQMTVANLDPRKTTGTEADKVHRTLLFEARFLARLNDAPYPLVEPPRPQPTRAQFSKGEAFVQELACLRCHTFDGTEAAQGKWRNEQGKTQDEDASGVQSGMSPQPAIAPNLVNVHRRLQWRWVDHWVQQTNLILPVGSPMPPFFDGLPGWHLDGLPAGQSTATLDQLPEEKRRKAQEWIDQYGSTARQQKDLLLNFLFAAGARNHTVVPGTKPTRP